MKKYIRTKKFSFKVIPLFINSLGEEALKHICTRTSDSTTIIWMQSENKFHIGCIVNYIK